MDTEFIYITSFKKHSMFPIIAEWNQQRCGYSVPFLCENSLKQFKKYSIFAESQLVNEATYEHEIDVDYIYENYCEPFLKEFFNNQESFLKIYKQKNIILYKRIGSEYLPSDIAKQAHEKNPAEIGIGISNGSNYNSLTKEDPRF